MADCGTSTHQAIEYRGLFDLQDAQIVRAQIDSIDLVAKTADVTLLDDPCEKLSWMPIEDVMFWYHCETSTGTIEDLARGYKAFAVGDMVYMLAIPSRGELPAQTYIVGHVDMKATRMCSVELIIILLGIEHPTLGATNVYAIYSPSLGTLIDIETFENFDESSPAKPDAAFGVYTTAVSDWVAYNFENVVVSVTMPYTLAVSSPFTWNLGSYTDSVDTETVYTGQISTTTAEGDACSGIDTGNEQYHRDYVTTATTATGGHWKHTIDNDRAGCGTFHCSGDQTCAIYWETGSNSSEWEYVFGDGIEYTITDGTTSASFDVPVECSYVDIERFEFTCGTDTFSYDELVFSTVYTQVFGFSSVGAADVTRITNLTETYADGTASRSATGSQLEVVASQVSGTGGNVYARSGAIVTNGYVNLIPGGLSWETPRGSTFIIGNEGVYGILCAFCWKEVYEATWGRLQVEQFNEIDYNVPSGWGGVVTTGRIDTPVTKIPQLITAGAVTFFDEAGIDTNVDVSVTECIQNVDVQRSQAFADVVSQLMDYAYSVVFPPGSEDEYNPSSTVQISQTPYYYLKKKKS